MDPMAWPVLGRTQVPLVALVASEVSRTAYTCASRKKVKSGVDTAMRIPAVSGGVLSTLVVEFCTDRFTMFCTHAADM